MKKIFAIMTIVVLIMSMGIVSFAVEKEKENYTVKVDLLEEPEQLVANKDTDEKHTNLKLGFTFINNTNNMLPVKDVGIKLIAKSTETMKEVKISNFKFENEKKYEIYQLNLEDEITFKANCEVNTKDAVWLTVYIGDDTVDTIVIKDNNNVIKSVDEVPIVFTVYPNTTTTAPTETSTTVTTTSTTMSTTEVTEPKPTETEVSTTEETYDTEIPTIVSEVDDYDYVAPIEDEIPATGSNGVALTAFGALGMTAIAAMLVTKKKKY